VKKKRAATQKVHFTERRLAALVPTDKRAVVYDTAVRKLGVKVEPSGKKTFFWWGFVPEEEQSTRAAKSMWKSIGDWPEVSLDDARSKAEHYNVLLANWRKDGCPRPSPFKVPTHLTSVPTFKELVEAYIENRIRPHALTPVRAEYYVRLRVGKYLRSWLDLPLNKVTVDRVLAAKHACGKHHYAANEVVSLVRAMFNWSAGKRDGKLNFWKVENPATDVSTYKKEKRKRFLQPDELVKFRKELENEQHKVLRDVLVLLLATGARKGNVCEMRWGDISLQLKRWHIPMSKSGEGYEVNLTPAAVEVLERRRREISETEPFVFPGRSRSGHIVDVKKRWTEFRKRCEFPDVRLHDIRRTMGSYLAISGVSLQQIGAVLGHKSLGSTEIYAQLHNEAVAKALETGDATMERMMKQAKKRAEGKKVAQLLGVIDVKNKKGIQLDP
jgi:integrase